MDFPDDKQALARDRGAIAWIVLAAGLILSGLAWHAARSLIDREVADHFRITVADAEGLIESRVRSYGDVLLGARALTLATADDFSGATFTTYVAGLDLGRRYPGIQVMHYAQRITAAERAAFEAEVRRSGEPGFAIKPPGERAEYVVVRHVAPRAGNEITLGLDLAGEPVRLDALNRVRDSGSLAASGPIALALDPQRYPGFAMRLPVYRRGVPTDSVAQRRAAFTGVISASFVVIDLMRGLFSTTLLEQVHIRIHDAGLAGDEQARAQPAADNLLFDSNRLLAEAVTTVAATAGAPGDLTHQSSLDVGGRRWDLYFSARPGSSSAVQRWLPWAVLLSGLAISLLLAGLVRSLQTSRARAVAWADRATADLRASEVRLTEEQRRTRELIEAIPNPIFFKGTDGRYLGVNKAWEELFGLSRDSFIGKTVHDLYSHQPEIADRLHAMDQILWRSAGTQTYETAITTAQGKTLDTVYYKATYTNPDGSVAGLIGTIVDITERKATEQRFRALFDNAAVGIITTDLQGNLTGVNQKFLDMVGYARDELLGRDLASIVPAVDHPREAQASAEVISAVVVTTTSEHRLTRKDYSMIWVRRTISAISGKDGRPDCLINVVEDITDRKQQELRRTMEYAVTRELAGEESLPDLFQKIIEIICRNMGWEFGLVWIWNHDQRALRYFTSWGAEAPALQKFIADCRERAIRPVPGEQQGLIRRAYASGEAVWISNITPAEGFRRAQLIWDAGLRGAFAFPLLRGSDVVGVMEFYHRNAHESEKTLIGTAQSIGRQIGQYMGRREAEEALKFVAAHDALTRLPNRMMFQQRLEHALALAQRGGSRLALLFIDLDHFKVINDTLGHDAGDTLLCEVAARLQGQLRASDTVARLGGDEFVVLVENVVDTASISDLARRLIEVLTAGFTLSGGEYHVTASIGASIYPDDGADAQTLLKHADIAMYRAKDQGRNRFLLYSA